MRQICYAKNQAGEITGKVNSLFKKKMATLTDGHLDCRTRRVLGKPKAESLRTVSILGKLPSGRTWISPED